MAGRHFQLVENERVSKITLFETQVRKATGVPVRTRTSSGTRVAKAGRPLALIRVCGLLLGLLVAGLCLAVEPPVDLTAIDRSLRELESRWERISDDHDAQAAWRERLGVLAAQAADCTRRAQAELDVLLAAAPATPAGAEPVEEPETFRNDRNRLQERLIDCRLHQTRVDDWRKRITERLARTRGSELLQVVDWWRAPGQLPTSGSWPWLGLALLLSLLVALRDRWHARHPGGAGAGLRPVLAPVLLAVPACAALLFAWWVGEPTGRQLAVLGLGAALSLGFTDALPRRRLPKHLRRPGLWLLIATVAAMLLTLAHAGWPWPLERPLEWDRFSGLVLLALLLAWGMFLYSVRHRSLPGHFVGIWLWITLPLLVLAIAALVLSRPNLAMFAANGIIGTSLAMFAGRWLYLLVHDLADGLDEGRTRSQRWLRNALGVRPGEPMPSSSWLRITVDLLLLLGLFSAVALSWRGTLLGLPRLPDLLREGIPLGAVRLVPYDVLLGVLTFTVLLVVSQRGKRLISDRLVQQGRVGIRSADAIVTVLGYLGVVLAAVVGLTVGGFKLRNLALIAGALSVGIGFGLQNVVNNFVSGLILLFERPVKPGDWVRVGETEGFVQRIRVRSTEIQGFDRSEIIVPNSEMIANRVTNLTLHDAVGRLVIPVGVAYGSDVEQVRQVLLAVAGAHPALIQEGNLAPRVLFMAFGDSALHFEVRAYLSDVLKTLDTRSELHFAIDRAFREAGIEIPFPQRTVHLPRGPRS